MIWYILVITLIVRIRISYIFTFALYAREKSNTPIIFLIVRVFGVKQTHTHNKHTCESETIASKICGGCPFIKHYQASLILILIVILPRDRTLSSVYIFYQPSPTLYLHFVCAWTFDTSTRLQRKKSIQNKMRLPPRLRQQLPSTGSLKESSSSF